MEQLSMFGLMEPPAPPPKAYEPPPRRPFLTRAYGEQHEMMIGLDEQDPVEMEVRGVPTLVRFSFGFQTYTVQPPGTLYWSETGFRSFAGYWTVGGGGITEADAAFIINREIDSKSGCNGKLVKWWPTYCLQWRQERAFEQKFKRETTWDQWGPEKQAEHWANFDARQNAALARMAAEGIDPDEVWRTRK